MTALARAMAAYTRELCFGVRAKVSWSTSRPSPSSGLSWVTPSISKHSGAQQLPPPRFTVGGVTALVGVRYPPGRPRTRAGEAIQSNDTSVESRPTPTLEESEKEPK